MAEPDPISPSRAAAHVLLLVILLCGGGIIELIKHQFEIPFLTKVAITIGELTILVYMLGALGSAYWWAILQWRNKAPAHARNSLRKLIPSKADILNVFSLGKFGFVSRNVLFVLITGFVFIAVELGPGLAVRSRSQSPSDWRSLDEFLIQVFNRYSPIALLVGAVLISLFAFGVIPMLFWRKRS